MLEGKPIAILADDDEQYLIGYGAFLEDLGYEVLKAKTRLELLAVAGRASVLIVDACLPEEGQMEGIEAVAELLNEEQTGGSRIAANVPIIFISGYQEDTRIVQEKLRRYPVLKRRGYRWMWKDHEFEMLSDAISEEKQRLNTG